MINKLYVPSCLCIEEILPKNYSHLLEDVHLTRLYQFVELVCYRGIAFGREHNFWSNLHCRRLEQEFTRNYHEYKSALIDSGIILCGENYSQGRYSKRYRIAPAYEGDYRSRKITNKQVLKKVNKRHALCDSFDKICIHMYRFLESLSLSSPSIHAENIYQAKLLSYIHSQLFYLKRDAYGRVHTTITNIKKRHRKQLRYHGKRLYPVDIKNSQPLLLNFLLSDLIKSGVIKKTTDAIKYQKLTQSGKFYQYIAKIYKVEEDKRQRLKPRLFRHVFFGRKTAKKFANYFPEVAKGLVYLKKGDFRNLARQLQKVESDLFIDKICTRIMLDRPEVPFFTIHDSILTTKDNLNYVKNVIKDEFLKFGLGVAL